jgi:hypothetical protein
MDCGPRVAESYVPAALEPGAWVSGSGESCRGYRWGEFIFVADTGTTGRTIWVIADCRTGRPVAWHHELNPALALAGLLITPRVAGRA